MNNTFANSRAEEIAQNYAGRVMLMVRSHENRVADFLFTCNLMRESFDMNFMLPIFKRLVGASSVITPEQLLGFFAAFSLNRTNFAEDLRSERPTNRKYQFLENKLVKIWGVDAEQVQFQLRISADASKTRLWIYQDKIIDLSNTDAGTLLKTGAGEIAKRANSNGSFIGSLRAMQEYIVEVLRGDTRYALGCP